MRHLFYIPLLALFVVPLGIDLASRDHALPSSPSPSVSITVPQDDNEEPSQVKISPAETPTPPTQQAASKAAVGVTDEPKPEPSPTLSTPTAPPIDIIAEMEAEILRLTNIERAAQGLSALQANAKLRAIAFGHSSNMLKNDYFDHDDPAGCSSSCRASNGGYRWKAIGENIYMMSGYRLAPQEMAARVVAGWIDSPGHRANILGTSFVESGVGVAIEGKDVYVTAVYGTQR